MRLRCAALVAALLLGTGRFCAADWSGLAAFEMEYLGENYVQELDLPVSDLSDATTGAADVSVTRLVDDLWLGGQRLDLLWRSPAGAGLQVDLESNTFHNAERLTQRFLARGARRGGGGLWVVEMEGHVRDEERSLAGNGDWNAEITSRYRRSLSAVWSGEIEAGWDHSRTLGDTTTFVYDYDLARVRLGVEAGSGWLPGWEARVEGLRKSIPEGLPGSYTELSAGGTRRTSGRRGWVFGLESRLRDYDVNADVGSDFREFDGDALGRPLGGTRHALLVEAEADVIDFSEEDDLYYDYARLTLYPAWEWKGAVWSTRFGPRARFLWDTGPGERDYRQWTARGEVGRPLGPLGYVQLTVEAGERDYRVEDADFTTIDAASVSFLRSDYRLLDFLLVTDVPLFAGLALRVIADSTLEFHDAGERINITFGNLALAFPF